MGRTTTARVERPTVVYTPDSPIRQPRRLLGEMARDLRAARLLAWRLLVRDISVQYRQTLLGYFWALLPPIVLTLVWVVLNSTQFVSISTGDLPYAVYALTGSIFWFLFVDALNAPLRQLNSNRAMLNRVNFPTEALILSGMGQALFSFGMKLVVLVALVIAYGVPIAWTAVLAVIPALALLAFGTMLGLLVAPIGLLYRDIENAIVAVIAPLMFVTPVVYPAPGGTIGRIMDLNPLTPAFNAVRDLVYDGRADSVTGATLLTLGVSVAVGGVAWFAYRLAMPVLVERMEA